MSLYEIIVDTMELCEKLQDRKKETAIAIINEKLSDLSLDNIDEIEIMIPHIIEFVITITKQRKKIMVNVKKKCFNFIK
jgi:hypothetical protein